MIKLSPKPQKYPIPKPRRLPVRKRMTIALGMVASDGVVLAADTQEMEGYFKGFSLKIKTAMTHTSIQAKVKSALAVTGAGPSVHLDALADKTIKLFHANQHTEIDALESNLAVCVRDFYMMHVAALAPNIDREFRLIAAAQIGDSFALWTTEATVLKRSISLEAVGTGSPFAKMALESRYLCTDVETAVLLSVLAVARAKEYDQDCGKGTQVVCLKDNLIYDVPWYLISEAEKLMNKYAGIEQSAFQYAIGVKSADENRRTSKISEWLQKLRTEFKQLASRMLEDQP